MKKARPGPQMPTVVRVGPYDFRIEPMSERESAAAKEYGHCDYATQTIRVWTGVGPQQLANTVVHEILHAIHWVYGLDDDSNEEAFTNQTANGLTALWRDNPGLVAWLNVCLGAKP